MIHLRDFSRFSLVDETLDRRRAVELHQRDEVELEQLQDGRQLENPVRFQDQEEESQERQVPELHDPAGEEANEADSVHPAPVFDGGRVENVGGGFVVSTDVEKEDGVAQDLDDVEGDADDGERHDVELLEVGRSLVEALLLARKVQILSYST